MAEMSDVFRERGGEIYVREGADHPRTKGILTDS
jgi:hypothetical protein